MAKKKVRPKKKKKTRVDFLREKYVDMPIKYINRREDNEETLISLDSFDKIIDADPSGNKQYVSWLLDIYSKGRLKLEDLYKAKEYLEYLYKYKHKLSESVEIEYDSKDEFGQDSKEKKTINPRNISDYWDLNQLYIQIEFLTEMDEEDLISESLMVKQQKEKDVIVIYDDNDWKVVVPLSQEMANLYGKGTKWCTTSTNSNGGMFSYYTQGQYPGSKLYIIINKNAKEGDRVTNKFQFHYESKQFMDARDGSVNLDSFFKEHPKLLNILSRIKFNFGLYLRLRYGIDWGDNIIEGDIDFSRFDFGSKSVPRNITVTGNAIFTDSSISVVENLKVGEDLILVGSSIKEIKGRLKVGKSIFAQDSSLSKIPNDTEIGRVGDFRGTQMEELPLGIKTGSHLMLTDTKIQEVKKRHKVDCGKYLFIHSLGIPDDEVEVVNAERILNCNLIKPKK